MLDGILDQRLNQVLLEMIAAKYAKIDAVPTHYYYPELFMVKKQ